MLGECLAWVELERQISASKTGEYSRERCSIAVLGKSSNSKGARDLLLGLHLEKAVGKTQAHLSSHGRLGRNMCWGGMQGTRVCAPQVLLFLVARAACK